MVTLDRHCAHCAAFTQQGWAEKKAKVEKDCTDFYSRAYLYCDAPELAQTKACHRCNWAAKKDLVLARLTWYCQRWQKAPYCDSLDMYGNKEEMIDLCARCKTMLSGTSIVTGELYL